MDVDILAYVGKLVYFHGNALNALCKILKIVILVFLSLTSWLFANVKDKLREHERYVG